MTYEAGSIGRRFDAYRQFTKTMAAGALRDITPPSASFWAEHENDIEVIINDSVKAITADYVVDLSAPFATPTITLTADAAVGDRIIVRLKQRAEQHEDISNVVFSPVTATTIALRGMLAAAVAADYAREHEGAGYITGIVTDDTIDGNGTAGNPLAVAEPFSAAEKAKLAGIPANATAGATAAQIAAINANTAKIGITPQQAAAIVANSAKVGLPNSPIGTVAIRGVNGWGGAQLGHNWTGEAADNPGFFTGQTFQYQNNVYWVEAAIAPGTAFGDILPTAITNLTAAGGGLTPQQAQAIADNTAKTGITADQAAAIVANTAKRSYPQSEQDKVAANSAKTGLYDVPAANYLGEWETEDTNNPAAGQVGYQNGYFLNETPETAGGAGATISLAVNDVITVRWNNMTFGATITRVGKTGSVIDFDANWTGGNAPLFAGSSGKAKFFLGANNTTESEKGIHTDGTTARGTGTAASPVRVIGGGSGITPEQAAAIAANTAKRTYPAADQQKLAGLVIPQAGVGFRYKQRIKPAALANLPAKTNIPGTNPAMTEYVVTLIPRTAGNATIELGAPFFVDATGEIRLVLAAGQAAIPAGSAIVGVARTRHWAQGAADNAPFRDTNAVGVNANTILDSHITGNGNIVISLNELSGNAEVPDNSANQALNAAPIDFRIDIAIRLINSSGNFVNVPNLAAAAGGNIYTGNAAVLFYQIYSTAIPEWMRQIPAPPSV